MAPILAIKDLSTHIQLTKSVVHAVGNVDLYIEAGETLGLVGESGCGKSMTGLSIMGLLPPGGSIVGGSIMLDGRELVGLPEDQLRKVRGNDIAMIFQDPLTSLDPTKTIGYQVAEPVRLHRGASKEEARERAAEVLGLVGLPRPRERLGDYPHQLSGGLRQRVMIATALSCEPKLLIADEPTTALDVTIQAQILALLDDLKTRLGMAMLLITHDMGVIAGHADRVNVMYAGRMVETTDTGTLFSHMHHPYTQALLASIPRLDQDNTQRLLSIGGLPPDLASPPPGCRFAARCSRATDKCRQDEPPLTGPSLEHLFSCWHPVDGPLALNLSPAGSDHADPVDIPVLVPGDDRQPPDPTVDAAVLTAGGARYLVHGPRGGDIRPGGRVGLREDHDRAHGRRPGEADLRLRTAERHRHLRIAPVRAASPPPRPPDDVPGSVLLARPADAGGRDHRRAAGHPARGQQEGAAAAGVRTARRGRAAPQRRRTLPARVFRRAAAADRAGPRADPESPGHRGRRAGERAGRVHPGAGAQPDEAAAGRARAHLHRDLA